jgi:broad specificity phosphatase PhoE
MVLSITLIRHGETAYNYDCSYLEQYDVPLTNNGCTQANQLIGHYDIVIISPLKRTRMTYECSHITGQSIMYMDDVREYRQCVCDFMDDEKIVYESESDITHRCDNFLQYLRTNFHNKNICIITHSNWISYFLGLIGSKLNGRIGNCQFITITLK